MRLKNYIISLVPILVAITAVLYNYKAIKSLVSDITMPYPSLEERIRRLEPEVPKSINDPPWNHEVFPRKAYPASEIIKNGTEIPMDFAYNNSTWKRQAYEPYWHSTVSGGRWSYVPLRIHYAMHRLFTTYPTASIYYDFTHELGIAEESSKFIEKHAGAFDSITTVVFRAQVQRILTYGNQVLIIAKPSRNGLQALNIQVNKIKPVNPKENILFQLVTEQGDEIDYSLISFVVPEQG